MNKRLIRHWEKRIETIHKTIVGLQTERLELREKIYNETNDKAGSGKGV